MTWAFQVIAITHSIWSGYFAIRIFLSIDDQKNIPKKHWSWKVHQFNLNFFGCIIGWIFLYILIIPHLGDKTFEIQKELNFKNIMLLLTAFVGITGYIPMIIIGLANSLSNIANKVAEAVAKFFLK